MQSNGSYFVLYFFYSFLFYEKIISQLQMRENIRIYCVYRDARNLTIIEIFVVTFNFPCKQNHWFVHIWDQHSHYLTHTISSSWKHNAIVVLTKISMFFQTRQIFTGKSNYFCSTYVKAFSWNCTLQLVGYFMIDFCGFLIVVWLGKVVTQKYHRKRKTIAISLHLCNIYT